MIGLLVICYVLSVHVSINFVQGTPLVSYAVTSTSPHYVYQLYEISALTKPEADAICTRCSTGSVAIIEGVTSHEFIRDTLVVQAGISNGSYWLGLTKQLFTWKWDDDSSLDWAPWASGNPGSGVKYAEAQVFGAAEWYSRAESYRQDTDSFLVCRYDGGSTVGVTDANWGAWGRCDVDRRQQVRRKTCTSPAADVTVGCTCEDRVTETRDCPATLQELNQSSTSGVIYQQYYWSADWFQALPLCGRCETGTIVMPKTSDDDEDIKSTLTTALNQDYFIGLSYDAGSGDWRWQDGSPADWTGWGLGSPGSNPDPSFVASMRWYDVLGFDGVYWTNRLVTFVTESVICQYDPSHSGQYGEWEPWGGCISDFTGTWTGVRTRRKRCKAPDFPDSGGCSCEDEVSESEACTPSAVDLYFTGSDAYLLLQAGTDIAGANQICATWCPTDPVGVVQYQSQSKYQDIYQNLLSPHGYQRHHVGLSDVTMEGYWTWEDGSKHGGFPAWQTTSQCGGYLLNHALITTLTSYLTPVMYNSSFNVDMSDSIVCEFRDVTGPNGTYAAWGAWSDCDAAAGIQTRNRTCLVPAPTLIGCRCAEDDTQTKNCTTNATSTSSQTQTTSTSTTSKATTTTLSTTPSTTSILPTSITSTTAQTSSMSTTQTVASSTTTFSAISSSTAIQPSPITVPIAQTSAATTQTNVCICPNNCQTPVNDETVNEKVQQLIANLTIEKTTLASFRRRLTSADDVRPSARNIGICVGSLVVGVIASLLVVMDFKFAVEFMNKLKGVFD